MIDNTIDQIHIVLKKLNLSKLKSSRTELNGLIDNIEKKYEIIILDDYRELLLNYKDLFFDDEISFVPIENTPYTSEDTTQSFDGFFHLQGDDNLEKQIECYYSRMPKSLIPIGECSGGNLICLEVKTETFGKVYFWDHENEFEGKKMAGIISLEESIDEYWENLYLVSNSLFDFLNSLKISPDETDIDVDDIEIWLDEDLLND